MAFCIERIVGKTTNIVVFKKNRLPSALLIMLCCTLCLYYVFPLWMQYSPKCIVYLLTGYKCPTCGNQRALHCFLHGQWHQAIEYNPFILFMLACFVLYVILKLSKNENTSQIVGVVFLIGYLIWFVVRNIIHV